MSIDKGREKTVTPFKDYIAIFDRGETGTVSTNNSH